MIEILLQSLGVANAPPVTSDILYPSSTVVGSRLDYIANNDIDAFAVVGYEAAGATVPRCWIFEKKSGNYQEVQKLPLTNFQYAGPVAFSGNTVFVRNPSAKNIYVYKKDIGGTNEYLKTHTIINSSSAQGNSVGEGFICANGDWVFGNANYSGAHVICYKFENGEYVKKQVITKDGNSYFGHYGMTFDGEFLIVNARMDSTVTTYGGAVFIYKLIDGQFIEQQVLRISNPTYMLQFGTSVLPIGKDTLVITASVGNTQNNYIYIFKKIDGVFVKVFEKAVSYNNSFALSSKLYKNKVVFNNYSFNGNKGVIRFYSGLADDFLIEVPEMNIKGEGTIQFMGFGLATTPTELLATYWGSSIRPAITVNK